VDGGRVANPCCLGWAIHSMTPSRLRYRRRGHRQEVHTVSRMDQPVLRVVNKQNAYDRRLFERDSIACRAEP
jgi:hypothetical protein